jgi:3'-phosphoadenosine 5'-phosphosulfate sulfotransferase (PAPS reductase)/FAD synthetase
MDRETAAREAEAAGILAGVVARHGPSHTFALFSGGHDSLCSTHLAMASGLAAAVVHVNTGIGIERTRRFVRDTCRGYGWPLIELHPPPPPYRDRHGRPWGEPGQTPYEAMVIRWGFPGPSGHTLMYNRLKERCIARLLRDHKDGRRPVVLVTGVRRKESRRRMGHIVSEQREGRRVWCAPLCDWDDRDKEAYAARHSLPVNEVAKRLCMSGECLCGAFARPEELAEIRAVCPETHDYIRRLELAVRDAGQTRCRWGEKPPPSRRTGRADRPDQPWLPLCEDCVRKRD